MPQWNLLLLESMCMSSISLVTLHAERKVVAAHAIESVHELRDWLHTPIADEPKIISLFHQLVLCCFLHFSGGIFGHLFFKVILLTVFIDEVVMSLMFNFIKEILDGL